MKRFLTYVLALHAALAAAALLWAAQARFPGPLTDALSPVWASPWEMGKAAFFPLLAASPVLWATQKGGSRGGLCLMALSGAVLALALMALNVLTSESVNGARNWLEVAGYSLQPSELVKVAYIYVGASTLDRLYRRRNLYSYIAFSAACVIALALIGDFGTALIFFATFLVISFMRSGSIATVILAVTGAGLAGFLAVSVKPYIAQRFANWGHVWEDIYNTGFQQTRAMSAAASGALFGKGAGSGWLHNVFAANTDMVFAMICEEQGLIIALCSIAAILVLAFFAVRSASRSRSAFYSIAACATVSMLLVQLSLNVFGSLDILPFTGVTFPFVSRGGTSLLSCWMLMAFIKGSDTRREGSFAVRPVTAESRAEEDEEEEHHHHHHHDDENGVCSCGHHHHDDDDDDDEDEHEHHHEHGDHCCCGHHHHHHHDGHDADEVFTSWGVETAKKIAKADIEHALTELDSGKYGMILRSKGIVDGGADGWLEFDYVPGEWEVRSRGADVGGKLVVIGSKLDEKAIAGLFGC